MRVAVTTAGTPRGHRAVTHPGPSTGPPPSNPPGTPTPGRTGPRDAVHGAQHALPLGLGQARQLALRHGGPRRPRWPPLFMGPGTAGSQRGPGEPAGPGVAAGAGCVQSTAPPLHYNLPPPNAAAPRGAPSRHAPPRAGTRGDGDGDNAAEPVPAARPTAPLCPPHPKVSPLIPSDPSGASPVRLCPPPKVPTGEMNIPLGEGGTKGHPGVLWGHRNVPWAPRRGGTSAGTTPCVHTCVQMCPHACPPPRHTRVQPLPRAWRTPRCRKAAAEAGHGRVAKDVPGPVPVPVPPPAQHQHFAVTQNPHIYYQNSQSERGEIITGREITGGGGHGGGGARRPGRRQSPPWPPRRPPWGGAGGRPRPAGGCCASRGTPSAPGPWPAAAGSATPGFC